MVGGGPDNGLKGRPLHHQSTFCRKYELVRKQKQTEIVLKSRAKIQIAVQYTEKGERRTTIRPTVQYTKRLISTK